MSQEHKSSSPPDPVLEITTSILTEAVQRPWLAALLMRRKPVWLTRLLQLAQWIRNLPRHTRRTLRRKLAYGLAAAALLLALAGTPTAYAGTITVDGDGTGITCSLADAITTANTGSNTGNCTGGSAGADTINLTVDVGLTAALPTIPTNITIEGNNHTISRTSGTMRILTVSTSGGNLTLNAATISGGNSTQKGCGLYNDNYSTLTVTNSTITGNVCGGSYANGAGIFNGHHGTLTVSNSTISNNSTGNNGGGIANRYNSTLTVSNSTVSGNSSRRGAGIQNDSSSTANVQNSTISGNTIPIGGRGGGLYNSGTLTVINSTVSQNSASAGAGIGNYGAGIATVQNSIVAAQTSGADCGGFSTPRVTTGGYNIESSTSCFGATPGTGDQQNVSNASLKLLALANNGGPTLTHALDNGSVALEKVPAGTNGCGTTTTTDQRGYARPGTRNQPTNKCEIGAWEAQVTDPTAITLRELTATANTSPGVIGAVGAALAALGVMLVGRRRRRAA